MAFVVFLDANVIYDAMIRDILLTLAEDGVFRVHWSTDVLEEFKRARIRHLQRKGRWDDHVEQKIERTIELMNRTFPEALVKASQYQTLIPAMGNDPKDRHVLAAAIVAGASVIVTYNVKHFPFEICDPLGIEVQNPDTFLLHQLQLVPRRVVPRIFSLLQIRVKEPYSSWQSLNEALKDRVPNFQRALSKHPLARHLFAGNDILESQSEEDGLDCL